MKNDAKTGIAWNKVTWYSKSIALVLFVALPFIGFWYGTKYGELIAPLTAPALIEATTTTTTSVSSGGTGAEYYANTAEWQTDANNTAGGFSIAYPIDFPTTDNYLGAPSTDWRVGANGTPGITYFTLSIPSAFEPQTNFADAKLTVGASANATAVSACLEQDANGPPATATSTATINGIQFTVFKSSDAGAGNMYETTSYRTTHAGKCYAVEYTIHSSQIGNYPPQYNLQPFDQTQATDVLDRIVGTFTFM
jgi:hypothetical protein